MCTEEEQANKVKVKCSGQGSRGRSAQLSPTPDEWPWARKYCSRRSCCVARGARRAWEDSKLAPPHCLGPALPHTGCKRGEFGVQSGLTAPPAAVNRQGWAPDSVPSAEKAGWHVLPGQLLGTRASSPQRGAQRQGRLQDGAGWRPGYFHNSGHKTKGDRTLRSPPPTPHPTAITTVTANAASCITCNGNGPCTGGIKPESTRCDKCHRRRHFQKCAPQPQPTNPQRRSSRPHAANNDFVLFQGAPGDLSQGHPGLVRTPGSPFPELSPEPRAAHSPLPPRSVDTAL